MTFLIIFGVCIVAAALFFLLMNIKTFFGKKNSVTEDCTGCQFYEQHHGDVISQTKKAVESIEQ
jgi:hypothetical protein